MGQRTERNSSNLPGTTRRTALGLALFSILAAAAPLQAQPDDSLTVTRARVSSADEAAGAPQSRRSSNRSRKSSRSSSRKSAARARSSAAIASEMANFAALKGSRPKVQGTYFNTVNRGATFYQTMDEARAAISSGKFVPLYGNQYYATYHMTLAYATPQAKAFIEALAPQFVEHCDEMMVVTSALRPKEKSPRNGSPWTVHPTGIAVDIRKPRNQACKPWLRQVLLDYQNQGYVDATEEFHPPHFHVAVIKAPPAPTRVVSTSNGEVTAVVR